MLEHKIEDGVLFLRPHGHLTEDDFVAVTADVDACIAEFGPLRGLLIHASEFPGWATFGAMVAHLRFAKNHHHDVKSIAMVTNDTVTSHFPDFASHFVDAEIRRFAYDDSEAAITWICRH